MVDRFRFVPRLWVILCVVSAIAGGLSLVPVGWWQTHLTFGSGESIAQAAPLMPKLWLGLAAGALLIAIILGVWGRRLENATMQRLTAWADTDSTSWSAGRWLMLSAAMVLWFDWPALIWGYFESDDFVFLANNREVAFPDLLYVVMNDHVFPLARVWIRLCHRLFGVNAWCYSALALISLTALLWSGCLLLREMRASVLAVIVFLALNIGWTMWGEFTSGEYILLAYQSLMTAAMLAAWSVLRWYRTGNTVYSASLGFALLYAGLINLSGLWVSCAALVFAFFEAIGRYQTDEWGLVRERTWSLVARISGCVMMLIVFYWYAFHRPGGPQFLSVAGERGGLSSFIGQILYVEATAWMSFLLPIPHHLSDIGLMWPAVGITLVGSTALVTISLQGLPRLLRGRLIACLVVSLGVVTMVALGRPNNGIANVVPPKYLFLPYHMLCLAAGLVAAGLVKRTSIHRNFMLKAICMVVLTCWLSHGTASLLGTQGVPFMDTTRGGELREHRQERAALDDIRRILNESLHLDHSQTITIPDISGASLCKHYPALRFPWGEEPPLSWFIDVLAAAPERVTFVKPNDGQLKSVSPKFIEALRQHDELAALYAELD